jgi:Domain of unknown function (DUF4272)
LYLEEHWKARDAQLCERSMPPGIGIEIAQERHHAIKWITGYEGLPWDDVTTDTYGSSDIARDKQNWVITSNDASISPADASKMTAPANVWIFSRVAFTGRWSFLSVGIS